MNEAWLRTAVKRRRRRHGKAISVAVKKRWRERPESFKIARSPRIKLSARRFIKALEGMIARAKPPARVVDVAPPVHTPPPPRIPRHWFGVDVAP